MRTSSSVPSLVSIRNCRKRVTFDKMQKEDPTIDICEFCSSPATKKCGGCKRVHYCSKEHQKDHWKIHKQQCKPFLVQKNESKGRFLIAVRDITLNELIIKEEPLVIGPKFFSPNPVCLGCLKAVTVSSAAKCPKCRWPMCDVKCGRSSNNHQIECDFLSAATDNNNKEKKSYKYEWITPIRCWLQKKYNPEKWNIILNMECHMKFRTKGTLIYREIEDLYQNLRNTILKNLPIDDSISQNEFHQLCGIIDVNSLDVAHGSGELSALYSTFSMLEHSCMSNVKVSISKFYVTVRAAKSISKDASLSTMYTNLLWGTQVRQQHLLSTKYFTCSCTRCKDPYELGTNFSSIKCLQDNCKGYILLKEPTNVNSSWECSKCHIIMPSKDFNDIFCRLSDEVEQVTEQKKPDIMVVQSLLEKLLSVLHPNHYHCFAIKHVLIQLYGNKKGYQYFQMSHELLNKKLEYCRELLFTLSRLDPTGSRVPLYSAVTNYELSSAILEVMKRTLAETMNLLLIQDDAEEAKRLLTKAVSLLSDTKGNDTSLQLIYSCKCLYKTIEDVMQGQCITFGTT